MKVLKTIFILLSIIFVTFACGKDERVPLTAGLASNVIGESASVLSEDDLIDMEVTGGTLDVQSLAPEAIEPAEIQPVEVSDGRVLALLNPNFLWPRPLLLRTIRAPLTTLLYFYANQPSGCPPDVQGTCPSLQSPNSSCTITFNFTPECNATAVTYILGQQVTLTFTGGLSGTIDGNNGLPVLTATASDLKIASDSGKYLIYNGTVKKEFTDISFTGANWVLSTSDLEVTDSAGAKGTASGTRTVEVKYGSYYHAVNLGTLTYTPPNSPKVVTIDIDIERTVTREELKKVVVIDDKITTDGILRTLSGTLTFSGEERGESSELDSVTLNGELTRTGPKGSVTVIYGDVVFKMTCNHNPWGGQIEITNGEKSIVIDFREDCGCIVDITWPNGETTQHNTCEDKEPGEE